MKQMTWRQSQALICVYWRTETYSHVKMSQLVGDLGLSFIISSVQRDRFVEPGKHVFYEENVVILCPDAGDW